MSTYMRQKAEIEQAITERLTDHEALTDDQAEIRTILGEEKIAVYVQPPEIEYETWHIRTATYTVRLVHPVATDEALALSELLELVERLEPLEPWGLEEARPALYDGVTPEYVLKLKA